MKNNIRIKLGIRLTIIIILILSISAAAVLFSRAQMPQELRTAEITAQKTDFKAWEKAEFFISLGSQPKKTSLIPQALAESGVKIDVSVLDSSGSSREMDIDIENDSSKYKITLSPPRAFRPGSYKLTATLEKDGFSRDITQDFSWGVLALNPNKAIYRPNETTKISIGVLDERGVMVCNARVELRIMNYELGIDETLSTENGSIKVNKECESYEYTLTPDYETGFKLGPEGEYRLTLTAETRNGTHTIEDSIKVAENIPFEIERTSATRIYPLNTYPMIIEIKANEDYKGVVEEEVPSSFAIIKTKQDEKETDYAARIIEKEDKKTLRWQVDWKKGKNYKLSYVYDAPDISPEFYLLGNLALQNGFTEGRSWQIANDAAGTIFANADISTTNWTSGTCTSDLWDCINEGTTSPNDSDTIQTSNGVTDGDYVFTSTSSPGNVGTVTAFTITVRAKKTGGRTATLDVFYSTDGSDPSITIGSQATLTESLVDYTFTATGLSLTKTQIDALRIKFRGNAASSGAGGATAVQVTASQTDITYDIQTVSVSGSVFNAGTSDALTECDGDSGTHELSLRTEGVTYTASCSSADGSYTFTSVIPGSAGSGMIIWIDDAQAPETDGAIAIRYDGSGNSTSNTFYDDTVTVTSDDTNGVTNTIMNTYDNDTGDAEGGDIDIPYTVTSGNLTVSSGYELLVKIKSGVAGGSTVFAPGGTVTTNATGGDFHIDDNSAASLDTATNSIGRDILIDTGATLTISGSTTVGGGDITATGTLATSGTPTVTIRGTGSISGAGTKTIYNLTVGDATTATTTLSDTLTVSNDASVGTGSTFNINADLTVTGSLTNTITGIINHTANSPVVTVSGTSIGGGSGAITFYRLQKAGAGTTTFSGSGTNTINDTLDATAGTLTLSTDNVITVTRDVSASTSATLNQNTALTINGGNLLTTGTGVVNTTAGTGTVTINGSGGDIGGGGTVTIYNLVLGGTGTQTLASATTSSTDVSVPAGKTLELNDQNLNVNGGDFTTTTTGSITCSGCSAGTVTMSGTGSLGGGSGDITFYNLSTSGTGTTTFSGSGTNSVLNNVSVGALTTLNINSTISITGNLTNATSGVIGTSAGTPTVTVQGTSIGGGTTGTITFYNLTKAGAGTTTFTNGGTNTINNDLSISNGTFTQSNALTVTNDVSVATGATFNTNANLNINGGDFTTTTTGVVNTTAGTGTVTISGTGNVGPGSGGSFTVYNLTIDGSQTFIGTIITTNDLAVNANDTLALNNQNVTVGGGDFTTGSGATVSCGCTGGTVTVNGTAATGIGGNSVTVNFYNLTIGGTVPVVSPVITNNDLTSNGTLSGSQNVTVNGTVAGTGTINMSGGTFEQRVAAGENFGTTSDSNSWTFATLLFSNSSGADRTITTQTGGSGGITVSTLLQLGKSGDSNQTVLDAGNRTWTLSGTSGTPFDIVSPSSSSSLTANTSTFSYTGANGSGDTTIQNATYNNLTLNASDTFILEASPLAVDGDLTVTLGTLSLSSNSMTVGSSGVANSGDISVAGSLTQTASGTTTVRTSSGGAASIGGAGTLTFYNLTIAPAVASEPTITLGTGASQTITVSNDLTVGNGSNGVTVTALSNDPTIDINGSFTIAASGTFTASDTSPFRIATNFTNNGTFTNSSGTVTLDTTNTAVLNGSGTPAITFHNLTITTAGKIVEFTAGKTFRTNGLWTVTGTDGNRVRLESTSAGTQWTINHQGTESMSYVRVQDSACDGSSTQITLDTTSVDGGNNGSCWVFQVGKRVQGNTRIKGNTRFR